MLRRLLLAGSFLFGGLGLAAGASTIASLAVPNAELLRTGTVARIEGSVTYCDPAWGLLFLQDATGAVFVSTANEPVSIPVGRRVAVTVRVFQAPNGLVWAGETYRLLGDDALPKPRPVSVAAIEDFSFDSQLVETTGVLRPQYEHTGYRVAFRLFQGERWSNRIRPPGRPPRPRRSPKSIWPRPPCTPGVLRVACWRSRSNSYSSRIRRAACCR